MKFLLANRIAPDGTTRFAASHLGLFCLPMSHKKDARLIRVNICSRVLNQVFQTFEITYHSLTYLALFDLDPV